MIGRIWGIFTLAFLLPPASYAADGDKLFPTVATIPQTREIRFTSKLNGEPFTLQIWEQRGFAGKTPKAGFSVLYLLDGELYFPFTQFYSNALPGDSPIIVGIGHDALNDKAVIARYAKLPPNATIGVDNANDAFFQFEIDGLHDTHLTRKSRAEMVGRRWQLYRRRCGHLSSGDRDGDQAQSGGDGSDNKNDQALFGHSLAGFTVVRALFTEPKAFRTFIASSPTIWWNRREVLKDEAAFANKVRSGAIAPRVLITAAADEDEVTISPDFVNSFPPAKAAELGAYVKKLREWGGMKAEAKALGERLKAIPGKNGYQAKYELIPGVNHGSEPRVSIWDALNFAFPR